MIHYLGIPFDIWALTSPFIGVLAMYCLYIIGYWVKTLYQSCSTNLARATNNGNLTMIWFYVSIGADINHDDSIKEKALLCAAENEHVYIMDFLMSRSTDVNQTKMVAVLKNKPENVKVSMLKKAAQYGCQETMRLLLQIGIAVDQEVDDFGNTALILAAKNGHLEVVKVLLKHGANRLQVNTRRASALMIASQFGRLRIVKVLLEGQNIIDQVDTDNRSALVLAAASGYFKIVELLVDKGANVNLATRRGNSALLWAAIHRRFDIAKLLITMSPDVNAMRINGEGALIWAARNYHYDLVKLLVDKGANVNVATRGGESALFWAVHHRRFDIVELFIRMSPDVNAMHIHGDGALIWAARNYHYDLVKLLVVKGANVNLVTRAGNSALRWAVTDRRYDIAKLLITMSPNVNAMHIHGDSALIWAIRNNNFKIVKMLVDQGVDVKQTAHAGTTALIYAMNRHNFNIAKYLIIKGADYTQVLNGQTVIVMLVDADPRNIMLFRQLEIGITEQMVFGQCKPLTRELLIYRPSHPNKEPSYTYPNTTELSRYFQEKNLFPYDPQKPIDYLIRALVFGRLMTSTYPPSASWQANKLGRTVMNDLFVLKTFFTIISKDNKSPHARLTRTSMNMVLLPILSFLIHPGFVREYHAYKIGKCLQKR